MAGLQELSTKYGGEFHGAVSRSLAPLTNREAGMESAWQLQNRPGIVTVCAVPYTADPPVQYASLDRAGSHSHRKWAEAGLSVSAQVAPVQEDRTLLAMVAARDHSPQKVAAPICGAGLQWVLGAALEDLITEIKEHLPRTSLCKKEVCNLSCCVLKSGVLSNPTSCTSQVVQLH